MAMMRYGSATVVEPHVTSEQWQKSVCCGHKGKCACGTNSCRTKVARTVIAKYSPEKYLLSHCSIIAAVDVDEAPTSKSAYKDYLIKPEYSKFVNNNGDAWTKTLLANAYRTFIGADNFLEHVQIKELSKGKVIDAALREVPVGKTKEGKDLTTFYVDILVATDRKHKDLVAKIESKQMQSLSMGCKIAFSICSKCGNKAVDETQSCEHVRYEKNNTFYDDNGVQRKVAELCGHINDKESVTFMDASWVANPAFTGAVVRNVITPPEDVLAKIKKAEKKEAYTYNASDFLKAAKLAADPKEETPENPWAGDVPKEDAPAAAEAPAEGGTPEGEVPAEAPADEATPADPASTPEEAAPEEALPEEPGRDDLKQWKIKIKQKLLKQIGDEISSELSGEDEEGPIGPDSLDESLIQPTASTALKQMWSMKNSWDKYLKKTAGHLDEKSYSKLKFGTYMILTGNDMSALKDYGYNRRDFLAVLSSLDGCFKNPLPLDVKKAVASLSGTKGMTLDKLSFAIQKLSGRKLSNEEINKSVVWLKLMDSYGEA